MVYLQEGKRVPNYGADVTGASGGDKQDEMDEREDGTRKSNILGRDIYGSEHSMYSLSLVLMKEGCSIKR